MKSFFPTFFASCLGVFAAFALCIFILIGMGISGMAKSDTYSDNSILKLKLEDFIPEKTDNINQEPTDLLQSSPDAIGLTRILKLLDAASKDKKIKGILIENNFVGVGQASLLSLMEGLAKFKESGKFIYSYADSHSQSSYMLCSVADSMFINPQGGVDLKGYGASIPFLKNMLDKIGVEMNIFYAGNFKSATEPFRLTEMSDFNKLQTRTFLEDMKSIMVEQISKNRNLSPEKIETIIEGMEGRTAKKALENGLVDALFYKDQLDDFLRNKLGVKEGKKLKTVTLSKYNTLADIDDDGGEKDKIAIIHAEGEIIYGSDDSGVISEKKYISMLTKIRNDKNIKAVVLRVNSPGGNAFTSDVIWRELERIKEAGKPVIASFGDYAASGGYYIAAGADRIVAQPNTLTGSIGVFMMFPNATKLLNDKIGVRFDTVKTNEFATGFSPMINLSDKEKALLQESTMEIYDLFIDRVSKGRKLSVDSTKVIAQGRVWTGRAAQKIGLVDELGNLDDAIRIAAEKAGIEKYKTVDYPFLKDDFMTTIIREIQKGNGEDDVMSLFSTKAERKMLDQYKQFKAIMRLQEPTARLPYIFSFD
ncbi:MAG: signal peptide peptidase SppA [Saprospiraceae bacterium]|jgi:protease-4|nr:signal peptide peptidase SppA [Saprospiraceae bacterium]